MEYRVAFEFVIGLSNEEPLNRRTTTQPTLVAAKVWASLYPSSKRNVVYLGKNYPYKQIMSLAGTQTRARLRHYRTHVCAPYLEVSTTGVKHEFR